MSCDSGGRDQSDADVNDGMPRTDGHHQEHGRREEVSAQSQREHGFVATLVSDF